MAFYSQIQAEIERTLCCLWLETGMAVGNNEKNIVGLYGLGKKK